MVRPDDPRETANHSRIRGFAWWRRVMPPTIVPPHVTGAIVAKVASRDDTGLTAPDLGAYIARATERGDCARVPPGVVVMARLVVTMNRFPWRPVLTHAGRHMTLD